MAKRIDSFVWTDDEVELLLRITLEYKASKFQDNVDWESCQSKYADIMEKFLAQYPSQPTDKDFPHNGFIAKSQVTAKLKNVRAKYRQAVDTGRRSGQGRVIRIFFELCEKIWGGSHPSRCIDAGIETGDLDECAPLPSPQSSPQSRSPSIEPPADSSNSNASVENLPAPSLRPRRELLQAEQSPRGQAEEKGGDPAV
ncbi:uncharacterized protein si:ch211-174j14.2 [Mugil cephalus]|uniref:uncharacterized protein si:ch211-174j14.2 n=1 Tax=Mugil cephalus TaxID=48193 RepID=UPI001FB609C5|nr:uncharacterized protein si:ch211-174j14.2 [Mugil cephalus]